MHWRPLNFFSKETKVDILTLEKFRVKTLRTILESVIRILPSFAILYLGHYYNDLRIFVVGALLCVVIAIIYTTKLSRIILGRIIHLYPELKKLPLTFQRSLRIGITLTLLFPILYIFLLTFLAFKRKVGGRTPFFFAKPFSLQFMYFYLALLILTPIVNVALMGAVSKLQPTPYRCTYWISTPMINWLVKSVYDVDQISILSKETKENLRAEQSTHSDAREKVLAHLDHDSLRSSSMAVLIMPALGVGVHTLIDSHSRTPANQTNKLGLRLEYYDTHLKILEKLNHRGGPSLLQLGPLVFLNPGSYLEISMVYSLDLLLKRTTKETYAHGLQERLTNLEAKLLNTPNTAAELARTQKILRELKEISRN